MNYTRTHLERKLPQYSRLVVLIFQYSDNGHFPLGWIPTHIFQFILNWIEIVKAENRN